MHYDEVIQLTINLGFTAGALMYVSAWFIGEALHGVLSVFKTIIKK